LLFWYIRTYGRWAVRHEPYSFLIYPLIAAIGPVFWWLTVSPKAGLIVLAVTEGVVVLWWVSAFYARRKRFGTVRPPK
jgi:hypothetical protein